VTVFTVDVDWAPEPVIAETLSLFQSHRVKCTLFATHPSKVLDACDRDLFEIAIHPNFNPMLAGQVGDPARVVDELLEMFPEARGVRSHSAAANTPLLQLFRSRGLEYESNLWLPYWDDIKPFRLWNGLMRIPYNWGDDIHLAYGRPFETPQIPTAGSLTVVDFHPVHVYLNTDTTSHYEAARPHYHDADRLHALRNTERAGARTVLLQLLQQKSGGMTLSELAKAQPA